MHKIAALLFLAVITLSPAGEERWSQDVRDLLRPEARDAAFARMVQSYNKRPDVSSGDLEAKHVKDVVVCKQVKGEPLIAVFLASTYDKPDGSPRQGHFVLLDTDGVMLKTYQNANSLDRGDVFRDVNGDGIVDRISAWNQMFDRGALLKRLVVIPTTAQQEPSLMVLYRISGYSWRMNKDQATGLEEIQIGKKTKSSFSPVVTYRWSVERARWEGDDGGAGKDFIRVTHPEEMNEAAAKLLAAPETVRPSRKQEFAAPEFPKDFKMLGRRDGQMNTDMGTASYIDVDTEKDKMRVGLRLFMPPMGVWKLKSPTSMLDGARDNITTGPGALELVSETKLSLGDIPGRSFLFRDKKTQSIVRQDYLIIYPDVFIFSYTGPEAGLELPSVRAFFASLKIIPASPAAAPEKP